jgi:hypothetical protein
VADVAVTALSQHLELLAEGGLSQWKGYLAITVVLREVDGSLEGFDGNLSPRGETDCIIDAGSHPLPDLFDGLEGGVETQLHDVLSTQNSAEHLQMGPILSSYTEVDALF